MIFHRFECKPPTKWPCRKLGTERSQETASTMSLTGFGLLRFEVIEVFAGYAASDLTQPTGTKWVTEAGIKPWKSLIKPTKNKTFSNKVGWDKQSVPNVNPYFSKSRPFVSVVLLNDRPGPALLRHAG